MEVRQPSGWESFEGIELRKCFKYFSTHSSSVDAELAFQGLSGPLAPIHSTEENQFLQDFFYNDYDRIWIGGTDNDHNGNWEWTEGSPFDFTYWYSVIPYFGKIVQ